MPLTLPALSGPEWCVTADTFSRERVASEETMFTLANGHHGVRGSLEFARHLGSPGSFFAGCYDRTPIYFEELVNTPAWVDLTIQTGGLFLDPAGVEVGEVERAYRSFRVSAYRDMLFRKNDDGIHAACLGGTWQACVNGFGGLRVRADGLDFRPRLPPAWNRLAYTVLWQGRRIAVEITPATVSVRLAAGKPLAVTIHGRAVTLTRRTVNVPLPG